MQTADFDYHLPPEQIAQTPLPRGEARLLILGRDTGAVTLGHFADLPGYLKEGDTLVLNDTRVTARRIMARREGGQEAETLLLQPRGETDWEALVRPGRRLRPGAHLTYTLPDGNLLTAQVVDVTPEGGRILRLDSTASRDRLASEGSTPLPPYIHARLDDETRYQTVYAASSPTGGSAAAPTAGLHFTDEMLDRIQVQGVRIATVTLHVGVDTFRPVKVENLDEHVMHGEWYSVSEEAADMINTTPGRVVAIGTTSVRVLESAASEPGRNVRAGSGVTRLFIRPGYAFKIVEAILTNFHLPKSTLLMLISAFAGREQVLSAYETAVREEFRFFSFGDAMLIM